MSAKQLKLWVTAHVWRSGELWFSPSATGVIRLGGRCLNLLSHLGGPLGFHLLVTDHYITREMKICKEGFFFCVILDLVFDMTRAATVKITYGSEQNLGSTLLLWSLGEVVCLYNEPALEGSCDYSDAKWEGHDSIFKVLVVNGCSFTCLLSLLLRKISHWPVS